MTEIPLKNLSLFRYAYSGTLPAILLFYYVIAYNYIIIILVRFLVLNIANK